MNGIYGNGIALSEKVLDYLYENSTVNQVKVSGDEGTEGTE